MRSVVLLFLFTRLPFILSCKGFPEFPDVCGFGSFPSKAAFLEELDKLDAEGCFKLKTSIRLFTPCVFDMHTCVQIETEYRKDYNFRMACIDDAFPHTEILATMKDGPNNTKIVQELKKEPFPSLRIPANCLENPGVDIPSYVSVEDGTVVRAIIRCSKDKLVRTVPRRALNPISIPSNPHAQGPLITTAKTETTKQPVPLSPSPSNRTSEWESQWLPRVYSGWQIFTMSFLFGTMHAVPVTTLLINYYNKMSIRMKQD